MRGDLYTLPEGLPVPEDDGAASHLPGTAVPPLGLASTDGAPMRVDVVPEGFNRLVVYAYPRMGKPGEDPLTPDWDLIPGARGCTPQACGFRDHAAELQQMGAAVAGLATEDSEYQREAVERLHLPFPLLSDSGLALTRALHLPTFVVAGQTLLRRHTLVIRAGYVEHVFYPVFPPTESASTVLDWLSAQLA